MNVAYFVWVNMIWHFWERFGSKIRYIWQWAPKISWQLCVKCQIVLFILIAVLNYGSILVITPIEWCIWLHNIYWRHAACIFNIFAFFITVVLWNNLSARLKAVSLKADRTTTARPHNDRSHDCTHLAITTAHILSTLYTCTCWPSSHDRIVRTNFEFLFDFINISVTHFTFYILKFNQFLIYVFRRCILHLHLPIFTAWLNVCAVWLCGHCAVADLLLRS